MAQLKIFEKYESKYKEFESFLALYLSDDTYFMNNFHFNFEI